MERVLETEWLDALPADDPDAQHSRGDLRRLNWLMQHARLFAAACQGLPKPRRLCDLGAGDGTLLLQFVQRMRWRAVEIVLIDQQSLVRDETLRRFETRHCTVQIVAADAFRALAEVADCDVLLANLFLHHFSREQLRELLRLVAQRTHTFVACEPRRSFISLAASHCLGAIGCNHVTRHDAVLSVRAGFRGVELGELWPAAQGWQLAERQAGLFSHLFRAQKS